MEIPKIGPIVKSIKQFYDYYLKGKEAPEWWSKGLKYKGDYMLK